MALTPEDIEAHTFKVARRGYDKVEVDRFLGQVATDDRQLQEAAATGPGARRATDVLTPAAYTPQAAPVVAPPLPRREPPSFGSPTTTPGGQLFAVDEAAAGPAAAPAAPTPPTVAPTVAPAADEPAGDGDDFNRLG